jgi:tetratricopeptide (TPR) repeat protein
MGKETLESLCSKAQQAIARNEIEEARQFYLQALALRHDSPDVHYGLATVSFLTNDLTSASHHFKEVTRLDPLRAGAYINLGAVYNRLDQLDEAIPVLRRGIQLDLNRAEGYYNLGLVYKRKGQIDLSIQAYREATRVNPRMADAHYNLANLYVEKQQYGMAIAHYRQALDLRPNWPKAENGLAQAEAAQESLDAPPPRSEGAAAVHAAQTATAPAATAVAHDLERMVDPNVHGTLLSYLHKATIESENQGRHFLDILESEIEPAIKELSSCLLYPDTSANELDLCVRRFETAIESMRNAQRGLQTSIDRVRSIGDQLLKG